MMRTTNIELLRIFTMFLIVLFHYHAPIFEPNYQYMGSPYAWYVAEVLTAIMTFGGKVGVQIFVIIAGYFLVTLSFDKKKLFRFVFQCYFWNLVILSFVVFILGFEVETRALVEALFPLTPLNWFARAYLMLYLAFPYINRHIIQRVTQKQLLYIVLGGIVLLFFIPTVMQNASNSYPAKFISFSELYLIGAYLRLYGNKLLEKYIYIYATLSVLFTVSIIMMLAYQHVFDHSFVVFISKEFAYAHDNSFGALGMALGLFTLFENLKIPYNKRINKIATTTFAVYLIHANGVLGDWPYDIFHVEIFSQSLILMMLYMLTTSVIIFAVCSVLELARVKYIEKPVMRKLEDLHIFRQYV